jgi:Collagen triple helix repeat (20 copies)
MKSALIAAIVAAVVAAASSTAATIVVTSKNIKNGTIQTVDISAKAKRALRGNRGPRGTQGPVGAQGAPGAAGPAGPQGPPGVQSILQMPNSVSVAPGANGTVTAVCPAGQRAVSGGFSFGGITTGSYRDGTGWTATGFNDLTTPMNLMVWANCSPNLTS